MSSSLRRVFLCSLVCTIGTISSFPDLGGANTPQGSCPQPALSRFLSHKVASGENLQSIAQKYNLSTDAIATVNPNIRGNSLAVGSEILIPPFDGTVVEIPRGQTWRQVAKRYKVRPDVLFEINGCQESPKVVFVPKGKNTGSSVATRPLPSTRNNSTPIQFTGYPLPEAGTVALPYGWQVNPTTKEIIFHSGIDLLSQIGTPVSAIADGTVAFAGEQGSYGNLVVINHKGGLQSRYAHLESIKVEVNQKVQEGTVLGVVGNTGKPTINQPHLHFEVRSSSSLGWVAQDPQEYLKKY